MICNKTHICNLSGYLSPPPIAGSQLLARATISLYYTQTIKSNLNLIIYQSSPGFEPGSPGPKAATQPLCYTPLTFVKEKFSMHYCLIGLVLG